MTQQLLFPKKLTRQELNTLVDRAADLIRTAVDYKFILVLLFFKRTNDIWKKEKEEAKRRLIDDAKLSEKEAEEAVDKSEDFYTFNIPKQFLWEEITKDVRNLPGNLATAISEVAKLNKDLQGVIDRVDFLEFARNEENRELLRQLVELFNKYDLAGEEVSPDLLGDAYEHIIMRFAPQRAKEGEIYTPREVIRLMVEILDPKPGQSIYDPCCGSGGMLIVSHSHVAERHREEGARRLFLYGQERNPTIYAIGQMNLLLHNIKNREIVDGDTLDYPKFRENGNLKTFDVVIANPPWNQDGYGEDRLKRSDFRERFSFGYPPKDKADWAWVQHMLVSSRGKVGIVLDQGALFRGGSEKKIRKEVVEKDWVDCIVLLPPKLFYNTGASGILVFFDKNKPESRKGKVLVINGIEEFDKHPEVRRLNTLSGHNIDKISNAYKDFKDVEGFVRVTDLEGIRENDYNLNVPLYAPLAEKEEEINIKEVYGQLEKLRKEREELEDKVREHLEGIMKAL